MIVFYYENFSVGGAETMMARMSEWFLSRDERVYIFSKYVSGDVNWINDLLDGKCTEFVVDSKFDKKRIYKSIESRMDIANENIIFCMMSVYPTIEFQYAFYLNDRIKNFKIINFAITTIKEAQRINCLDVVVKKMFRKVLNSLICNYALIGMVDYQTVESAYDIKFNSKGCFHLPMQGGPLSLGKKTDDNGNFNILTVSRAEFPFKGYIFGLIDIFGFLVKKYSNLKLTIVSYGEDIEKLRTKIRECDELVRKNIVLLGPISYKEISEKIADSSVYVGMGTTLLDAAKIGKPCIPVNTYTYDIPKTCYWCNNPHYLEASNSQCYEFDYLIEELINMNVDRYNELSLKTYEVFNEYYEINNVMDGLLKYVSNQKETKYSVACMMCINYLFRLTSRLKRLENNYL